MQDRKIDIRKARIQRPAPPVMQMEDTGHLWAISYADFLMVILSFFVIFFSVEKSQKNTLIHNIMAGINGAKSGSGTGFAGNGDRVDRIPSSLPQDMKLSFPNRRMTSAVQGEKIIISFPDDIYKKGEVELGREGKELLSELVRQLSPFSKDIAIGFVGHTDALPVMLLPGRQLVNNYDVSAVRASKALALAAAEGLPIDSLYASGAGTNLRQSRSLSIVIRAKGEGPL